MKKGYTEKDVYYTAVTTNPPIWEFSDVKTKRAFDRDVEKLRKKIYKKK